MKHIPDTAVQAAANYIALGIDNGSTPRAIAENALNAALPHLPLGYEVKKLEWVAINDGEAFRALLPFIGSVLVEPYGVCGWWEILWSMPGQCDKLIPDVFDTPEQAKAAAQADFERRVLECLVVKPVDVAAVRRQALEAEIDTAIEKLLDIQQDINFEANSRMSQSLCDASAYIDKHEAFLRRIRALSAEPAQGEQWQSITHLQLNGDEYLTWNGRRQHVARFDKVDNTWVSSFTTVTKRLPISPQPTHFSHLPAAPTPEDK